MDSPTPWTGRTVRFICGAAIGLILGIAWGEANWWIASGIAVGVGLLAAYAGDEFWKEFPWLWW